MAAAKAEPADETLRPGVAGSADGRMQKAYEALLAMSNPPTPSTRFAKAFRFMGRDLSSVEAGGGPATPSSRGPRTAGSRRRWRACKDEGDH